MTAPQRTGTIKGLVDAHYESLYRYAYRLSGSAADAEDLTQEAFCKAQAGLAQLRNPGCVKAWLFSILRNAYLRRLRRDQQRRFVSLDEIGDVSEALPDPPPAVEPGQLQAALDELPEAFRSPLILFYFEDFSYRDIAEHLDLPLGTVMSRLARAKAYLRERLLRPAETPAPGRRRATDGL